MNKNKIGNLFIKRIKTIRVDKEESYNLDDMFIIDDVFMKNCVLYTTGLVTTTSDVNMPRQFVKIHLSGKYLSGSRFRISLWLDKNGVQYEKIKTLLIKHK